MSLRQLTLEDLPMDHSMSDTTRMRDRRRQDQQIHKLKMAAIRDESRNLSSYSRRRFENALGNRQCGKTQETTPTDNSLFWKDPIPQWNCARHHSIAVPPSRSDEEKIAKLAEKRPFSEPVPGTNNQFFNHVRGSPDVYPGIKNLVKSYN